MTNRIIVQFLLLIVLASIFTAFVSSLLQETKPSIVSLAYDSKNNSDTNIKYSNGQLRGFLKRMVREADGVVKLLSDTAGDGSKDIYVFEDVEDLGYLEATGSKSVRLKSWNGLIIACIISISDNLIVLAIDPFNKYVTDIREIPETLACELTTVFGGHLIIVCVSRNVEDGVGNPENVIRVYHLEQSGSGFSLKDHQVLHENYSSHIALWHQYGETRMMVSSSSQKLQGDSASSGLLGHWSIIYRWTGNYFDRVQQFQSSEASAAHHFVINNQHFIAEAHFNDNRGHHNCYSTIYRYSMDSKQYIPHQYLPTKGAKHFTSFSLSTDARTNTFLAVANFCQDDQDGICQPSTKSGIYCYHHDRFVLFQEIPTTHAVQWLAVQMDNTVLLAVVNFLKDVAMYQYNGWRFVSVDLQFSPRPITFGAGVSGLASVTIDEDSFLGVVNQQVMISSHMSVLFKLNFKKQNFLKEYYAVSENWCNLRLKSLKSATYPSVSDISVPLSNSSKYIFSRPVTIDGDLTVQQSSNVEKIFLRSTNETLPGVPAGLDKKVEELQVRSRHIAKTWQATIPAKGNVSWPDGLHFLHFDSSKSPNQDFVGDLRGDYINGIPFSENDVILLKDNLSVPYLHITNIEMKADVKVSVLSGHPIADYATLVDDHTFVENVTFQEPIKTHVTDSRNIISQTDDGHLRHLSIVDLQSLNHIHCSSASAVSVDCVHLNGINVSSLFEEVVTRSGDWNITGPVEIVGDLVYRDDLYANVSESINLDTPLRSDILDVQFITGDHKIQNVKTDWLKGSKVNDVSIPQQVFINNTNIEQVLPPVHFTTLQANSLHVKRNLDVIKVINGNLDVMKLNKDQFVTSQKSFDKIILSSRVQIEDETLDDYFHTGVVEDPNVMLVLNVTRSVAEIRNLIELINANLDTTIRMPWRYKRYLEYLRSYADDHNSALELLQLGHKRGNIGVRVNVPINQTDVIVTTSNSKKFEVFLEEILVITQLKWLDIYKMFEVGRVRIANAFESHHSIYNSLFPVLKKTFDLNKNATRESRDNFGLVSEIENEVNQDIQSYICNVIYQLTQYPVILRRLVKLPLTQVAVMSKFLIDFKFSQMVKHLSSIDGVSLLLDNDISCYIPSNSELQGIEMVLEDYPGYKSESSIGHVRLRRDADLYEYCSSCLHEGAENSGTALPDKCKDLLQSEKMNRNGLNFTSMQPSYDGVEDLNRHVLVTTNDLKPVDDPDVINDYLISAINVDHSFQKAVDEHMISKNVKAISVNSALIFVSSEDSKGNPSGLVLRTPCTNTSGNGGQVVSADIKYPHKRNVREASQESEVIDYIDGDLEMDFPRPLSYGEPVLEGIAIDYEMPDFMFPLDFFGDPGIDTDFTSGPSGTTADTQGLQHKQVLENPQILGHNFHSSRSLDATINQNTEFADIPFAILNMPGVLEVPELTPSKSSKPTATSSFHASPSPETYGKHDKGFAEMNDILDGLAYDNGFAEMNDILDGLAYDNGFAEMNDILDGLAYMPAVQVDQKYTVNKLFAPTTTSSLHVSHSSETYRNHDKGFAEMFGILDGLGYPVVQVDKKYTEMKLPTPKTASSLSAYLSLESIYDNGLPGFQYGIDDLIHIPYTHKRQTRAHPVLYFATEPPTSTAAYTLYLSHSSELTETYDRDFTLPQNSAEMENYALENPVSDIVDEVSLSLPEDSSLNFMSIVQASDLFGDSSAYVASALSQRYHATYLASSVKDPLTITERPFSSDFLSPLSDDLFSDILSSSSAEYWVSSSSKYWDSSFNTIRPFSDSLDSLSSMAIEETPQMSSVYLPRITPLASPFEDSSLSLTTSLSSHEITTPTSILDDSSVISEISSHAEYSALEISTPLGMSSSPMVALPTDTYSTRVSSSQITKSFSTTIVTVSQYLSSEDSSYVSDNSSKLPMVTEYLGLYSDAIPVLNFEESSGTTIPSSSSFSYTAVLASKVENWSLTPEIPSSSRFSTVVSTSLLTTSLPPLFSVEYITSSDFHSAPFSASEFEDLSSANAISLSSDIPHIAVLTSEGNWLQTPKILSSFNINPTPISSLLTTEISYPPNLGSDSFLPDTTFEDSSVSDLPTSYTSTEDSSSWNNLVTSYAPFDDLSSLTGLSPSYNLYDDFPIIDSSPIVDEEYINASALVTPSSDLTDISTDLTLTHVTLSVTDNALSESATDVAQVFVLASSSSSSLVLVKGSSTYVSQVKAIYSLLESEVNSEDDTYDTLMLDDVLTDYSYPSQPMSVVDTRDTSSFHKLEDLEKPKSFNILHPSFDYNNNIDTVTPLFNDLDGFETDSFTRVFELGYVPDVNANDFISDALISSVMEKKLSEIYDMGNVLESPFVKAVGKNEMQDNYSTYVAERVSSFGTDFGPIESSTYISQVKASNLLLELEINSEEEDTYDTLLLEEILRENSFSTRLTFLVDSSDISSLRTLEDLEKPESFNILHPSFDYIDNIDKATPLFNDLDAFKTESLTQVLELEYVPDVNAYLFNSDALISSVMDEKSQIYDLGDSHHLSNALESPFVKPAGENGEIQDIYSTYIAEKISPVGTDFELIGNLPPYGSTYGVLLAGKQSGFSDPSYSVNGITSRYPLTTTSFVTQITTLVTCVSCTFIFNTHIHIISSTVLTETVPVTVAERCALDNTNMVIGSALFDVSDVAESGLNENSAISLTLPNFLPNSNEMLKSISHRSTETVSVNSISYIAADNFSAISAYIADDIEKGTSYIAAEAVHDYSTVYIATSTVSDYSTHYIVDYSIRYVVPDPGELMYGRSFSDKMREPLQSEKLAGINIDLLTAVPDINIDLPSADSDISIDLPTTVPDINIDSPTVVRDINIDLPTVVRDINIDLPTADSDINIDLPTTVPDIKIDLPTAVPEKEFVTRQLEEVLDYIIVFRGFASRNFTLGHFYSQSVYKSMERNVNSNLKYLWMLRYDSDSWRDTHDQLNKHLKSIDFLQRLSNYYAIPMNMASFLKSVMDSDWFKDMVNSLTIRLKMSRGHLPSLEEKEFLEKMLEGSEGSLASPPPIFKVEEEIDVYPKKMKMISSMRELLEKLEQKRNRITVRQTREARNLSLDLFEQSEKLRSYLEPIVRDAGVQYSDEYKANIMGVLKDYDAVTDYYDKHPTEKTQEAVEIIDENVILIKNALHKLDYISDELQEKFDQMTSETVDKSDPESPVVKEGNYSANQQNQTYINTLIVYLNDLEKKLMESLPLFINSDIKDSSRNISDSGLSEVQSVVDALGNDVWSFRNNMHDLNVIASFSPEDSLILGEVSTSYSDQWNHLIKTIPVALSNIFDALEQRDCSHMHLLDLGSDINLVASLSYDIQSSLSELNSTRPWNLSSGLILNNNSSLNAHLAGQINKFLMTLGHLLVDFVPRIRYSDALSLKNQFSSMNVMLDFVKVADTYFSNLISVKLDILEALLANSIADVQDVIECIESTYTSNSTSLHTTQINTSHIVTSVNISEASYAQLNISESDATQLKIFLHFTRRVLEINPFTGERLLDKTIVADLERVSFLAEKVLWTLKSIVNHLQNRTVKVHTETLDDLGEQHHSLMDEVKGYTDHLSAEARLKLLMIYGESGNGRAVVAERMLVEALENISSETSRSFNLALPRNYIDAHSEEGIKVYNSWVIGKVAGYAMRDFLLLSPPLALGPEESQSYLSKNINHIRKINVTGNLNVSIMNNVDLDRLVHHAVPLNNSRIPAKFIFRGRVTFEGDIKAATLNNMDIESLVLCSDDAVFKRPVTFARDIEVNKHVAVQGGLNGIDIGTFSYSVIKTHALHRSFTTNITFKNLRADRIYSEDVTVSGIPLQQVAQKGHPITFTGRKTFLSLKVGEEVNLGALNVHYINDIDIPRILRDTLWKNSDEPQRVPQAVELERLIANNDTKTGGLAYFNRRNEFTTVDLVRLAQTLIYKDEDTTLTGNVVVNGFVNIGNLYFYDTLNGVPAKTFNDGWLLRTSDQVIYGRLSVLNMKSASVTTKEGVRIFEVDIGRMINAVKINDSTLFTSTVNFGDLESPVSVVADGFVQGWNLTAEGISKYADSVIFTAPKTFTNVIEVTSNIEVKSLINSMDLQRQCHTAPSNKLTIEGNAHFVKRASSLMLETGSHEMKGNPSETYWLKDRDVVFENKVTFHQASMTTINGTINNVNLSDLLQRSSRKSCVDLEKILRDGFISHLVTSHFHTKSVSAQVINGYLRESFNHILRTTGDQTFTGAAGFKSISIKGSVTSGLQSESLMGRFCRYQEVCVVNATKNFTKHVTVTGNLLPSANSTIQGVDLSRVLADMLSDHGHIKGTTRFNGSVRLSDLSVGGLVDGVAVTGDTVLLRVGDQVIRTPIKISSISGRAVSSPRISAAHWDEGCDITQLHSNAVRLETLNIFKEPVVFEKPVKYNSSMMGLDHHLDYETLEVPSDSLEVIRNLSLLNQYVLRNQLHDLRGWLHVQDFEEPLETIIPIKLDSKASSFTGNRTDDVDHLALVPSLGSTSVLSRSFTDQQFHASGITLEGDCAKRVVGYSEESDDYMLTSHSCPQGHQQEGEMLKVWKLLPQGVQLRQLLEIQSIDDMEVVIFDDKVCVLVVDSNTKKISLYCMEKENLILSKVFDESAHKVSVLQSKDLPGKNLTLFALANRGEYPRRKGYFAVWVYDRTEEEFQKIQMIELEMVVWVDMVAHQGEIFIVAVSQSFSGDRAGQVNIYKLDLGTNYDYHQYDPVHPLQALGKYSSESLPTGKISFVQQILIKKPFEAHFSNFGTSLYLFIIDQEGFITWYAQKGVQRFIEVGKLHLAGKQQLEVWVSQADNTDAPWLAVSGEDCNLQDLTYNQKDSQILRAIVRGRRFDP